MRPTKLSLLLLLFAVPVFVYAWLMNSTAAIAVAVVILGFLFLRGGLFLSQLKSYATSLKISRVTDSAILTQGGHVSVSASVQAMKTPLSVTLQDKPPVGSVLVQGSTQYENSRAEYLLRMPVSGTSLFGGVTVHASDLFFATDLTLSYASSPKIKVYAAGISATFSQDGFSPVDDSLERDRYALIAGTETRYFRPYVSGDNVADINWKMTARYDELYVQLRSDSSGVNPVLILDLPEEGTSTDLIAAFAEAATGVIERLTQRETYPVLVYSGADCLWIGNSKHEGEIFAYMSLAGKVRRETSLFRHKHVSALMKEAAAITTQTEFSRKMKDALSMSQGRYPTRFEQNIKHITADTSLADAANTPTHDDTSIYVVSCAMGDTSNLSYLIPDAAVQRRDVVFVLAGIRGSSRESSVLSALYRSGASAIEVVS